MASVKLSWKKSPDPSPEPSRRRRRRSSDPELKPAFAALEEALRTGKEQRVDGFPDRRELELVSQHLYKYINKNHPKLKFSYHSRPPFEARQTWIMFIRVVER